MTDAGALVDERRWLDVEHVTEVLARLRHDALVTEVSVGALTSRGLELVASASGRGPDRTSHLITLAGADKEDAPLLEALAVVLGAALQVEPRVHVEGAHVTLHFTLGALEERALRARLASWDSGRALEVVAAAALDHAREERATRKPTSSAR